MNKPEDFGTTIAGSRWFNSEPKIVERLMVPIQERWLCPMDSCGGEMKFNGSTWPMSDPGYHHTCTKCEFTAAISSARYPRVTYRPAEAESR